ncbi:hypothetical protein [uncultured Thiodictyon sp.]|uniref:hypothetical protein n=1 Tax=uncultured Thiodictyon sp. TaxID=1846217 RepID=UPI0025FDEB6F|nr:hypothetical protein [uncultured Thiodictyon sp.]
MTESQCILVVSHGTEEFRGVADFIKEKGQEDTPLLAWADPDPLSVDVTNDTGRRSGFEPLVRGMPPWLADLPLAEARLFWATSALHVVARDGGGCVWARIEEHTEGRSESRVACSKMPVHTLRDLHRFGLEHGSAIKELFAVEYRQQGRLVAWRLTIKPQEHTDA